MMFISEYSLNDATVLVLEGRLDAIGAAELDSRLQEAVQKGENNLVLDMADVSYINSSGLRILARAKRHYRQTNLTLSNLRGNVERVFYITGFDKYLLY